MSNYEVWVTEANNLLANLRKANGDFEKLNFGINLANHLLGLLEHENPADAKTILGERVIQLPNAERFDSWFQDHPDFEGTKSTFTLTSEDAHIFEAKFYWLRKKTNSIMASAVQFSPNWEDAEWTRTDIYKVGIDFFLTPEGDSIVIALSNLGKIRVLEISGRLTNTDLEVLEKWTFTSGKPSRELLHSAIWESFQLQALNAKFYQGVASLFTELQLELVNAGKGENDAKLFASRLMGRLIFIWFLRKKGLVSETHGYFEPIGEDQALFYSSKVEHLFFGVLNTPMNDRAASVHAGQDVSTPYLNGGLFAPKEDDWQGERLSFPNKFFDRVFSHFQDFNFTTDESTPEYEQVAIDPEMLGRVFESLLATQLEATGEQARKAKGAFYTPREIVAHMCKEAVRSHLHTFDDLDPRLSLAIDQLLDKSDKDWASAGSNSLRDIPKDVRPHLLSALKSVRSIDPACGSGAFPMGLFNILSKLHQRIQPSADPYRTKLAIIQENIFGVDIEPMAIEISKLRSWLALIVEVPKNQVPEPLPNLEFNFACANSLRRLDDGNLFTDYQLEARLAELRRIYFSTSNPTEKKLIQSEYLNLTSKDSYDSRGDQLRQYNPFDVESSSDFFDPDLMFGITDGFNIVIGNPPYVDSEMMTKAMPEFRNYIRSNYKTARGNWDLFVPFCERAIELCSVNGTVSFIVKNSLMGAPYCAEIRKYISEFDLLELRDFGGIRVFESAAVDTCIFQIRNSRTSRFETTMAKMKDNEVVSYSRTVSKSELATSTNWIPLLASENRRNVLIHLGCLTNLGSLGLVSKAAASVSEAYKISEIVFENPKASLNSGEHKLINTGTIDPFVNEWGQKPTTYLGSKYDYPTVRNSDLSSISSKRAREANAAKIICIGMGNVEAFLDDSGQFIAGKTTNIIIDSETGPKANLAVITAILNSKIARFWFRENFLAAGMAGITPENLITMPLPKLGNEDEVELAKYYELAKLDPNGPARQAIDNLLYNLFGLTSEQIETIENLPA